jgi:hypothetical protein
MIGLNAPMMAPAKHFSQLFGGDHPRKTKGVKTMSLEEKKELLWKTSGGGKGHGGKVN